MISVLCLMIMTRIIGNSNLPNIFSMLRILSPSPYRELITRDLHDFELIELGLPPNWRAAMADLRRKVAAGIDDL